MDAGQSIRKSAGALNATIGSLKGFGIDSPVIDIMVKSVTLVSSGAQIYGGVKKAVDAFTAVKQTEFIAQLAKWGPYAAVIAPAALAAGYVVGNAIEDFMNRVG